MNVFCLQPTDDQDVDLFLTTEDHGEPGRDHNDMESVNWGSNVDQIQIQPSSSIFCQSCTFYLSVWGFYSAHYTLTASSTGITQLQMGRAQGGHSDTNAFQYYTIYMDDPFGILSLVVTSITGDADLYINTYKTGSTMTLPTREHNTWHAVYYGSDIIRIDYTDPNFCSECVYIVGVYGYRNASFTVMATDTTDTVIRLVTNRPQIASLPSAGNIGYFTATLRTSAEDITFSLTSLDTGYADMYVQAYNSTYYTQCVLNGQLPLPDPNNPRSYLGMIPCLIYNLEAHFN